MPMPIDLLVEYLMVQKVLHPVTHDELPNPNQGRTRTLNDWAWAYPTYEFSIAKAKSTLKASPSIRVL
jgi:hypothetical protein